MSPGQPFTCFAVIFPRAFDSTSSRPTTLTASSPASEELGDSNTKVPPQQHPSSRATGRVVCQSSVMASTSVTLALPLAVLLLYFFILEPVLFNPLSRIPGPKSFALTKWRLALEDWRGTRTRKILALHEEYGPVVRIGPNEVSFNSLSALRTIYGPGSQYGRTTFYRMFDVYGEQNLFTLHSAKSHGDRKKLLSHAYSKSAIYQERATTMVEEKVNNYMKLLETQPGGINDIFATLHYFSLDSITSFIYGRHGATSATQENAHQSLIDDIMDPSRRRLFWYLVHLSAPTKWLYAQAGILEHLVKPILPMQKPSTYTGIRNFALKAFKDFRSDKDAEKHRSDDANGELMINELAMVACL
jgi:hypothetical protein